MSDNGNPNEGSALNPYESPRTEISPVKPLTSQSVITENMLYHLKKTSPWLRFVGIVGFAACGLMTVFVVLLAGSVNSFISEAVPYVGQAFTATMVVTLVISLPLIFFPSFFLFNAGKKLRNYVHSGSEGDLETALKFNKFFWVFTGIVTIVYVSIVVLVLFFTMIGVIASASL
jgi:hypothetical protein